MSQTIYIIPCQKEVLKFLKTISIMATNIEVLASRRGRPLLTFNGNIFQFERDGLEKKTWRCDQFQKCKCRCRLHTSDNLRNPELLRQVGSHNHEPKPIACDVKKVMTKIRQAASSSSIAPAQLIANEIRQMPAASQGHMPLAHNIKRGIRKVRGVTTGSLIVPSKREDIKLPDSFKITSNNENFLAFDSGSHADRIMIFSTARNLEFLSQCNVWLVDGTFKVRVIFCYVILTNI